MSRSQWRRRLRWSSAFRSDFLYRDELASRGLYRQQQAKGEYTYSNIAQIEGGRR
ncbi:MAG: hypothetical protein KME25_29850 [Symplocastrum torsivum CPER-KK1]|uniref:Uncharacterized protein n=1 Tax=Symplocastrum torsivum CPER-KK1 TaxID=450513 RepID=A0A951PRJ9_9CYAN|nr:hypothetical protein [Symplocastrum torsivum CPER-KK1]